MWKEREKSESSCGETELRREKNLLEKEEEGKHFSLGITDRFVDRNPFTP